jgi:hypothetical protein
LIASDVSSLFGLSVDMDNLRLAVGDPYGLSDANGAVYIYDDNGTSWLESKQLSGDTMNNLGQFGWSVELVSNVLLLEPLVMIRP